MLALSPKYAQVGWIEYRLGARYTFTETGTNGGAFTRKIFAAKPIGSVTNYYTLYSSSSNAFRFLVNNSQIDSRSASFTPDHAEVYGEVHSYDDQMPGGYNSNAHETFRNTRISINSGGWQAYNGSGNTTGAPFHYISNDGGHYNLDIWDGACPS